jgi:flavin reductase (DIM6/NTAB) family NADH-FMN oxidoreductase RutF
MILKPHMREGVMPLPVTFVSTMSADRVRNIAPWSCVMPVLRPLDLVCLASAHQRDTLRNIRDTGEFVINMARVEQVDRVIPTARHVPPDVDEFTLAGIDEKPSEMVQAPGMAGAYAWMECALEREIEDQRYVLIVGKVLRLEILDEVLTDTGALDVSKARPLMMTSLRTGMSFASLYDINSFEPFGAMFDDGKDPFHPGSA